MVVRFGAVSKCIAEGAVAWKAPACGCTTNFPLATNEYRGANAGERTKYHSLVAWDRLAEVCVSSWAKGSSWPSRGNKSIDCCPVGWSMSGDAPFEP